MSIVDNAGLLKLQFDTGIFFTSEGEPPFELGSETAKCLIDDIERGKSREVTLD